MVLQLFFSPGFPQKSVSWGSPPERLASPEPSKCAVRASRWNGGRRELLFGGQSSGRAPLDKCVRIEEKNQWFPLLRSGGRGDEQRSGIDGAT